MLAAVGQPVPDTAHVSRFQVSLRTCSTNCLHFLLFPQFLLHCKVTLKLSPNK